MFNFYLEILLFRDYLIIAVRTGWVITPRRYFSYSNLVARLWDEL